MRNLPAIATVLLLPVSAAAGAPGPEEQEQTVISPAVELETGTAIETAATAADEIAVDVPEGLQPQAFAIDYRLRYGALSATLKLRLQQGEGSDNFRISATTRARGLARLFMSGEPFEQAKFSYTNDRVVSQTYRLESGKKSGEDNGSITFDWKNMIAASVYEGTAADLALPDSDIYDRISADVVVIMDLRNGRQPRNMRVAEKNQLRDYGFTFEGEATIETPAGTFDTVRYLRQRSGSSRSTRIWYASDKGFLPVRMEQLKNGKTAVTSEAKSVTLGTPQS